MMREKHELKLRLVIVFETKLLRKHFLGIKMAYSSKGIFTSTQLIYWQKQERLGAN